MAPSRNTCVRWCWQGVCLLMRYGVLRYAVLCYRALEFIAIRTDIVDDAEDRTEFEADTIMALIRVLSSGALTLSGSGRTAAARAAIPSPGPASSGGSNAAAPPSAAAVKAAAALLSLVVDASDPSMQQAAAAAVLPAAGGSSGSSVAAKGLGTAPAHPQPAAAGGVGRGVTNQGLGGGGGSPTKPPAAGGARAAGASPIRHSSLPPTLAGIGSGPASAAGAVDGTTTPPTALLPDVVMDHTSGLAVLRTWSCE